MESPAVSSRRILVGNSLKGKEKFKLLRSNLMKATGPTKTDALRITYFYWCGCLFAISDGFSRCIFSKLHVGISLKWKEVVALFIYFWITTKQRDQTNYKTKSDYGLDKSKSRESSSDSDNTCSELELFPTLSQQWRMCYVWIGVGMVTSNQFEFFDQFSNGYVMGWKGILQSYCLRTLSML